MTDEAHRWMVANDIRNRANQYRAAMGHPPWVDGQDNGGPAVKFYQHYGLLGWGPLMVRIELDGYATDFPHNDQFQIPPLKQWTKIPHEKKEKQ